MTLPERTDVKRISANLPQALVNGLDELKSEWGLRSRGLVLERLLENIFEDIDSSNQDDEIISSLSIATSVEDKVDINTSNYVEDKAIILIGNSDIDIGSKNITQQKDYIKKTENSSKTKRNQGIDLPGFVNRKTNKIKRSLHKSKIKNKNIDSFISTVKISEIHMSLEKCNSHWFSLYGNEPSENVIEAAMLWLARDIWPKIDGSDDNTFTWTGVNELMFQYCKDWESGTPCFNKIIVIAGVLEDPFSSNNLENRIPTLIRRFVNTFKRRQNVTSFQTIEATMTVHGALKLLDLPTQAGKSLSLSDIREAYKNKALINHPDSGGSTEIMRKLNEAYQLLKDLYKKK